MMNANVHIPVYEYPPYGVANYRLSPVASSSGNLVGYIVGPSGTTAGRGCSDDVIRIPSAERPARIPLNRAVRVAQMPSNPYGLTWKSASAT